MDDYLVKAIAKEEGVRCLACVTTELANEGARRHQTQPTASAVLARGLTSAALFGALLKIKQRVAIKFDGNGPIGKCVVESNSYGRIRGYVEKIDVELPRQFGSADISGALGNEGIVTVVKDTGLKDLHQGIVQLVDGTIEQDLLYYLHHSEQIESHMELDAVLTDTGLTDTGLTDTGLTDTGLTDTGINDSAILAAGGVLVQALPKKQADVLPRLMQRIEEMPSLAHQLENGKQPEDVVAEIFSGIEYEILEKRPLSFSCYCSWERTEKALLSIGKAELQSLFEEGEAVIDCHFCGERYVFGQEALETIIDKL